MASTEKRDGQDCDGMHRTDLRLVEVGESDPRAQGFPEACRSQSLLLKQDQHEQETLDWLEGVGDREGWK